MREDYINRISEIHRIAMESHNSFMRLVCPVLSRNESPYYNTGSTNRNIGDLNLNDIFRGNMTPITIDLTNLFNTTSNNEVPTNQEIENACELLIYSEIPEAEQTTTICPIDRQPFLPNDNVLRIRHCRHYFREANLRQNFQNNSLCPLCRHNIIHN